MSKQSTLASLALNRKAAQQPSQSMREFFERADVRALQDVQKRNHPASPEHKRATAEIERLGNAIGAGEYFNHTTLSISPL
jgi:hypothetical protein